MKAVWTSVILLIILLIGVFGNAYYIRTTAEHLRESAETLRAEEDRQEALLSLKSFWEEHQKWVGFSVGFRDLDHFGEILTGLQWALEVNDPSEFERYRLLLIDATEELERAERMNWKAIF